MSTWWTWSNIVEKTKFIWFHQRHSPRLKTQ
uniref:Uncharacterized protein n=1 Tax=Arundo donax TaxID=35708 RepID=A0A0A8Y546_ARUDO